MYSRDQINSFLQVMGKELGTEMELDPEGICLVENEEGIECEICAMPGREDFLLTSLVGEAGDDEEREYYEGLMMLNSAVGQTLGVTIALDPQNKLLMLHQMHSVRGLDLQQFNNLMEEFYATTETVTRFISARDFGESTPMLDDAAPQEVAVTADPPEHARWNRV